MTVCLMWEARAAEGCADALVDWVYEDALRELGGASRVEVFRSVQDGEERVVVITLWPDAPGKLPEPPAALVARAPHQWSFEKVEHPRGD